MVYIIQKDPEVVSTPKEKECHDSLSSIVMNTRGKVVALGLGTYFLDLSNFLVIHNKNHNISFIVHGLQDIDNPSTHLTNICEYLICAMDYVICLTVKNKTPGLS